MEKYSVTSCKKYNDAQRREYHKDCRELDRWINDPFPFLGAYIFDKNYGHVCFKAQSAYWFKTQKEAFLKLDSLNDCATG